MERKVFRSRISILLLCLVTGSFLPVLVPAIRSGNVDNFAFWIFVCMLIFCHGLFFGFSYVTTGGQLLFRIWGMPAGNITISKISSVERSYDALAGCSASLKRLKLRFEEGYNEFPYCLVSPVREQDFLDYLKKINPDIDIRVNSKQAWYRIWDWDI
jgi:hypothetical protein